MLDVDIGDLLGRSRPVPSAGEGQARVWAVRDALTSVDDLLGELDDIDAPDLGELDRSVTYGWGAYWAGRYGVLAAMLPRLLAESRAALHHAPAGAAGPAAGLAVQVHQLVASTLVRLDEADLGTWRPGSRCGWPPRSPTRCARPPRGRRWAMCSSGRAGSLMPNGSP
ncbi:MAG: hypothetical protein ACRDRZ_18195 [Pseudonocardiaceae bacterium]